MIFSTAHAAPTFDPLRVRQVDQQGDNYLFRGPMPKGGDGSFAKKELLDSFGPLPNDYQFVIISCLTYEREDEAEFLSRVAGLESVPRRVPIQIDKCSLYFWQVRAHTKPGTFIDLNGQRFEGHLLDFPGLIGKIEELMSSVKPTVIYLHCRHGINRTGAVTIAYLMRTQGLSLQEAYAKNFTYHPTHVHTYIYQPEQLLAYLNLYQSLLEAGEGVCRLAK